MNKRAKASVNTLVVPAEKTTKEIRAYVEFYLSAESSIPEKDLELHVYVGEVVGSYYIAKFDLASGNKSIITSEDSTDIKGEAKYPVVTDRGSPKLYKEYSPIRNDARRMVPDGVARSIFDAETNEQIGSTTRSGWTK